MTTFEKNSALAIGYHVLHAKRTGDDSTGGYGNWQYAGDFTPVNVNEGIAPNYARAKISLDLPAIQADAWDWKDYIAFDDMIAIVSDHVEVADRHCVFKGFVVDIDWSFASKDEGCIITAIGPAGRLNRDVVFSGRIMASKANKPIWVSSLQCVFNAGGKPNRRATALNGTSTVTHYRDCATQSDTPVFTYDGDPTALWWRPYDIYQYIQTFGNYRELDMTNYQLIAPDPAEPIVPTVIRIEGLRYWDATGVAARAVGDDVCEQFYNAGGAPGCRTSIKIQGDGTQRTVKKQPINADGSLPTLNMEDTDLLSASFAESVTSSVTRPVVFGGTTLYEITVTLQKTWSASKLTIPTGGIELPTSGGGGTPNTGSDYYKRYVTGGTQFSDYAAAGRLWDANSDGKYSSPLSVTDIAAVAGCEAGSWPVMNYKPRGCLTRQNTSAHSKRFGVVVEVNADGTWRPIRGLKVLPDRLGIYLTTENLASIPANPTEPLDGENNLFYAMVNGNVQMRMTCCVAAPHRNYSYPARRASAGTAFETVGFYDRKTLGQIRKRATSSRFYGGSLPADEVTAANAAKDLSVAVAAIQNVTESRLIEGSLPIEWPDHPIYLTDVIEAIDGIDYSFAVTDGNSESFDKKYPRVVGKTMQLTPKNFSMVLHLDTQRKAGSR